VGDASEIVAEVSIRPRNRTVPPTIQRPVDTSTPAAAREHARSQAGADAATTRTIPASSATDLPEGVAAGDVLWDETLASGGYASRSLPRGARLRMTDLEGDTCVALLLYNAENPVERFNAADTVKVQWNAYLADGRLLLSDMGRTLASVVADEGAEHDLLCGASSTARARLALALAKHGLGRADLMTNLNLFKAVRVAPDGALSFDPESSTAGAFVELRMDMDVLAGVGVGPHVLDERATAYAGRIRVLAVRGEAAGDDDPIRNSCPEATRAFENVDDYYLR
jgi:uncharacterized protein